MLNLKCNTNVYMHLRHALIKKILQNLQVLEFGRQIIIILEK